MSEKTLVKTVPLRPGRDWEWMADANIVLLAPHLDAAGRERALSEVQDFWRRSCLRVVGENTAPGAQAAGLANRTLREVIEAL